jgi:uncharacterized repeat protein (TIGR01451 family)
MVQQVPSHGLRGRRAGVVLGWVHQVGGFWFFDCNYRHAWEPPRGFSQAFFGGNPVPSNQAEATVNAEQKPALTINKTAQEASYAKAGDILHYSYLVTNVGNVTLHDAVTVSDNKATATCPALPAGGLVPGASITCTASYIITQADLDAGSMTNIAKASSARPPANRQCDVPAVQRLTSR